MFLQGCMSQPSFGKRGLEDVGRGSHSLGLVVPHRGLWRMQAIRSLWLCDTGMLASLQ
jgi:hypothetical protein